MALELETKRRTVLRTAFTTAANVLDNLLSETVDTRPWQQISVQWELLQVKYNELCVVESAVFEAMVEKASEAELISEMEAKDRYSTRYYELKYKCEDRPSLVSSESSIKGKSSFKLPPIEFKKYSGDLIDWLPFWSQFKVVHDDPSIDLNDKIAYLRQATVDGSKARRLVESFPAVADNYSKIIKSLKSRFGREDLQIEVYIRELLKLILSRVSSSSCNVSALYDMIESQLRSLETLGITADKYAAILYPLIESCLPEDMITLWHRSSQFLRPSGSVSMHNVEEYAEVSTLETRLSGLMSFLQNEVQNEQKINLATEGFGLSTENKCKSNNLVEKKNIKLPKQGTDQPSATAAGLVNYEVDRCIFCEGQHDSINCFKAQKLSMEQKRRTLSEKKACFRCLKVRHSSKNCRARLNCILCCKSHVVLMCPDLPVNKIDTSTSSISRSEENRTEDATLANLNNTQVFLQTLRVNIRSAHGTKQVRALIDTGSQRTYILQRTAQEMSFSAKGTENIVHTLFGGKSTSEQRHKLYKVTASEGAYSCSFDALDQPKICADVSPVYHGPWVEELSDMNISLSDVGHIAPIEILLGADVVGKLYTGRKYQLQCGLVAVETLLGWTLMGKVPAVASNFSTSMMSIALFVDSSSVAKLWELDIIGITDPVEKLTREVAAKEAKNFFYETIRCDNEGRYEVMLPWLNKHPLISDNLVVARRRLDTTLNKLKKSNLFESYNLIFNEWLNEGVIEIVNNPEENNCVHYLPHRPVIKNTSETTKIRPVFDASSHEQGRPSLNQCLEVGPNLIELIPSVLLRFRQQKIGVVSDIRKAFLQISVHSKDRDFLRFLWVNNEGKEFVFRHRRVVFGVNCSPFLLGATIEFHLIKALEKCCNDMPYSKNTIERLMIGFYVDNCVTSVTDENELRKFVSEATAIMEEAKMDLRGWESSGYVLNFVCVAEKANSPKKHWGKVWLA
ncbi:uncharacterized protein LOC126880664 [Diabrotica virgifera virgifera]|uniref:Peptidase aspartic putative domain-containing protein n=1 Tax=Diabrotica virgifera virgifera TaxID=50390 RepID=A0ABM5JRV4_DIAVI|nr:uncharacterized protein LOC126880664 [Diabrotica virgifera virgifera]